jgi:cullin-4
MKGTAEAEVDQKLNNVVLIFRYLQDKDVFEGYYKNYLASRLLQNKSASDEAEKSMISKLKNECGCGYTTKLEVMFKDIRASEECMAEFRAKSSYQRLATDLHVKVLTTGNWPNDKDSWQVPLPRELQDCQRLFQDFYLNRHTGRLLSWKNHLGSVELRAFFPNGKKHEFGVGTAQMLILLLFNDRSEFALREIRDALNLPATGGDLKRQLVALLKQKVLLAEGKDLKDSDQISLNDNFQNKLYKIKVGQVSNLEQQKIAH